MTRGLWRNNMCSKHNEQNNRPAEVQYHPPSFCGHKIFKKSTCSGHLNFSKITCTFPDGG